MRARGDGGHDLAIVPGKGWQCKVCLAYARCKNSLQVLQTRPCRGALAQRVHASHQIAETEGVIWCCRCGAYARRVLRSLRWQCVEAPPTQGFRAALKRLKDGLPPTTGHVSGMG
jgi:hypothetical protein